jgi:hypothetical protein
MRTRTTLAALLAFAVSASALFGGPIPNDEPHLPVLGMNEGTITWDDFRDIVGWKLYSTSDLTKSDDWDVESSGDFETLSKAVDMTPPGSKFFRLHAVKGPGGGGIPGSSAYEVALDVSGLNADLAAKSESPVAPASPITYAYTVPGSLVYGSLPTLPLPQDWTFAPVAL